VHRAATILGRFQADGLHRHLGSQFVRVPLRVMLSPGSFAQSGRCCSAVLLAVKLTLLMGLSQLAGGYHDLLVEAGNPNKSCASSDAINRQPFFGRAGKVTDEIYKKTSFWALPIR
jgi:hypothetical protein